MSDHERKDDPDRIQDLDLDESEEGREISEEVAGGRPVTERPVPGRPPTIS